MQAVDLPTIPTVAKKVVKELANPNTNLNALNKLISADQALSARILKIGNSALYYCQREIKSLNMAMSRIGFASLKSIVVAVSTKEIYKNYEDVWMWWEMVAVAYRKSVQGFNYDMYLRDLNLYSYSHPLWFKGGRP